MKIPHLFFALYMAAMLPLSADNSANAAITHLNRIFIPIIQLDNAKLDEALGFLWARSIESDTLELNPDHKGMRVITGKRCSVNVG